jgi:hypothetical protein
MQRVGFAPLIAAAGSHGVGQRIARIALGSRRFAAPQSQAAPGDQQIDALTAEAVLDGQRQRGTEGAAGGFQMSGLHAQSRLGQAADDQHLHIAAAAGIGDDAVQGLGGRLIAALAAQELGLSHVAAGEQALAVPQKGGGATAL